MTAYPSATYTPMMMTSNAGFELGVNKEPAAAIAATIATEIQTEMMELIRSGDARAAMIALHRDDPAALDERFRGLEPALEAAVPDHAAL